MSGMIFLGLIAVWCITGQIGWAAMILQDEDLKIRRIPDCIMLGSFVGVATLLIILDRKKGDKVLIKKRNNLKCPEKVDSI